MSGLTNMTNSSNTPLNQWCEDHQEGVIILTFFCVVSFVFGFPAAVAVFWDMLQRGRNQFTPYDVFVFSATIIDGIALLFSLPNAYNILRVHNMEFERLMNFLFPFNLYGRPLFTTCICLDCYLAVIHPVVYRTNKSLTPRVLTAGVVWTVTLLSSCLFVHYAASIDHFLFNLFFIMTLPIIGFCDVTIFWTLKRSNPTGGGVHPKKKKALQIIINNLVITFTSYLPPVIGMLVSKIFNVNLYATTCFILIPLTCSMLVGNTCSPIMYLINLEKLDWLKCLGQK